MKVVVTGDQGMLGRDLVERLRIAGFDLMGVDIDELDITRSDNVLDCLRSFVRILLSTVLLIQLLIRLNQSQNWLLL